MDKTSFWQQSIDQIYAELKSSKNGLSSSEAQERLKKYGPNSLKPPHRGKGLILFLSQFKSPLILLLIAAALLSFFVGGKLDAPIIFTIVLLSGLIGFYQERGAINTLEKMLQLVENKVMVLREGSEVEVPIEQIVPGDVVLLRAGDLVPGDCILIEASHFFIDEAVLTGESCPVEKNSGIPSGATEELKPTNALFLGTMVASGFAKAIVVATGRNTEYSSILEKIRFRPPRTAFELGIYKLGYFLLNVTVVLVIIIFAVNTYLHKPVIESFLFSLALAVGLTPQLLPAIISVNLSHGVRKMAQKHVIVKRLASIENFGQMDILCSDKTGTVTEGKIHLDQWVGIDGKESEKVALFAFLNAHFQAGYSNPLDQSILQKLQFNDSDWKKTDEVPYDFIRKRLSVVFNHSGDQILISKGAVPQMLAICNRVELSDGTIVPINDYKKKIEQQLEEQGNKGLKTLGVAYVLGQGDQEVNLIFLGFLHFLDPIKDGVMKAIEDLKNKGVKLKIISGDHQMVASYVAKQIGLNHTTVVTGAELNKMSDHALVKVVQTKHVFAQIEPNQKERIILALRRAGHVVGYLGDGVNDVSALHSADVGISVDSGADAAKEASDMVLLKKDLSVLLDGVEEGRRTFANTLKYIYMATSANFGNMFSMAGVSLFLPFLPLLPKQVLLNNFFSDLPEMALATDRVDSDTISRPVKWDLPLIRRFMLVFGALNSFADYLTFGVLLFWLKADQDYFRTAWFIENIISAALVIFVIRTRKSMFSSKPGRLLAVSIILVVLGIPFIPHTPLGALFDLTPIPLFFYVVLIGIITVYITAVELTKRIFFRKINNKLRNPTKA